MCLKCVHLRASHLLHVFPRDYISMLSVHKIGSLEKPDLVSITCALTNIQKFIFLKLVALEHQGRSLIKYTFYPVGQTHAKFILAKVMREGFAFSCITVIYFVSHFFKS